MQELMTAKQEVRTPLILVVDDDSENRQILTLLLECFNYKIETASNGKEAIEKARKLLPDVILLDVEMPLMNGVQACRELKSDPVTRPIPIIFLTGRTSVDDVVKGFEAGAVDYVAKPFQSAELLARVNTQLELKLSKDELQRSNEKILKMNRVLHEAYKCLEADLTEASNYVMSMISRPIKNQLQKPNTDWYFKPCKQLGGDMLGYHWLDDEHFVFYLLDVSGHGVGAALLSVSVMTLLSFEILNNTDFRNPACVLRKLNENFLMNDSSGLFYTIWYGVYKRSSHKIIFSNGGHPPPVIFTGSSAETSISVKLASPGILIGAIPGFKYTNREFELKEFNRLFLFSDGTYEVEKKSDGTLWKYENWVDLLAETNHRFPGAQGEDFDLEYLAQYVQKLNGSENLEDDFSILKIDF